MRYFLLFSVVGLILIQGCQPTQQATLSLPDGVELIEVHEADNRAKIIIPYTKYKLNNGLTVVLHEDHSDPLVHVDVTYHVGSAREQLSRSGFAHFFEHMMFQGSKHVADEEHLKLISEAGGDLNGTTNSDKTNYYETVPSNQLEKVLWLEADRMGYLLDAITEEKFEVQRATVKNERAQNVDNQPYGLLYETTSEALYPKGHPYSWPVIGYVSDLNRAKLSELKDFFNQWYGPNNAVLTIGGDIDVALTLQWIQKYFGPISTGPEVKPLPKDTVTLTENRYITIEDNVHLPLLQLTFPTVFVRHEDEAQLDVLSDILGGGKTSLFYKNMVKSGLAVSASVNHPCRELACEFQLFALPNPSRPDTLADIARVMHETLAEFETRGVSDDDLKRTKIAIESRTIFGLESVSGKVSSLAQNEIFFGVPDQAQFDLARYQAVTKDDVLRVYKKYIKNKPAVYTSVVPKGQTQLAAAEANFERPFSNQDLYKDVDFLKQANRADTFDRSVQPQSGPTPLVNVPSYWDETINEHISVLGHKTTETPTVGLVITMDGGPLLDPIDKAGLASITADLMNESTLHHSAEQLSNELSLLGSAISFSSFGRDTQIRVRSLSKNLPATMKLLEEKLFYPAFDEAEFNLIKERQLQGIQQSSKNAEALAKRAVDYVLYGANNRVSLPDGGTFETVQSISLDDVKTFYKQYYSSSKLSVVVVGDVAKKQALDYLSFLQNLKYNDYNIPNFSEFPKEKNNQLFFVDKPGAAQTIVTFVKHALPYDATGEHFLTKLMNYPLGGHFNSRINLNLREDKGYTYGAFSGFSGGKTLGEFFIRAAVTPEHTLASINEIFSETKALQDDGITADEMQSMRSSYTQSDALSYETPSDKAGFLQHLMRYELSADYRSAQLALINQVSADELNALAKKWLTTQDMQLIVVGDKQVVLPQLEQLGREIHQLELSTLN